MASEATQPPQRRFNRQAQRCMRFLAQHLALLRVLAAQFTLHLDTWRVMHEDLRHSPCCRVTFNALLEGLHAYLGVDR